MPAARRRSRHRHHDLPLDQAGGQVLTKLRFRDALLAQRLLELLLVELPGQVLEARNAGNLSIHHPLGRGQPCSRPNTSIALVLISWSTIVSKPPSAKKRVTSRSGTWLRSRSICRLTWSDTSVVVTFWSATSIKVSPACAGPAPPTPPVSTPVITTASATKPEQGEHDPGGTSAAEK
jgi:hypothetical protein